MNVKIEATNSIVLGVFSMATTVVTIAFSVACGIAALIIGSIYGSNTIVGYPVNLRAWLIVFGVSRLCAIFLLLDFLKYTKFCKSSSDEKTKVSNTSALFPFVWLIWGTVLIARENWTMNPIYTLSLTVIIIDWIMVPIIIVAGCILYCCAKKN